MKKRIAITVTLLYNCFLINTWLFAQDSNSKKEKNDILQFYVRLRTLDNKVTKGAFHCFINDSVYLIAVDKKYNLFAGIVRTMNEDSIVGFSSGQIKQINIMRNGLIVNPGNRKEKIAEETAMNFLTDGWWGTLSLRKAPKNSFDLPDSNYKTSPEFWKKLGRINAEHLHPRRGDLYIISGDRGRFRETVLILTGIKEKPYNPEE